MTVPREKGATMNMKDKNTKNWARTLIAALLVLLLAAGPGAPAFADSETDARLENIEGANKVIFTDTREEKEAYLPQTTWRATEQAAPAETCTLELVSVSDGLKEKTVKRFLDGKSTDLQIAPGESFLVELNGAHWLTGVKIQLSSESHLKMMITDISQISDYLTILLSGTEDYAVELTKLGRYIRFQCPETETEPVKLQSLTLFGIPSLYEQVLRETRNDSEVLGAKDSDNPLNIYRRPLKKSVFSLADLLLDGAEDASEFQKMMIFLDFISDWYIGFDDEADYLSLSSYISACGGYSNLFAALAATQGLKARLITLANYPLNDGHAVCEVFYDDAWHLFDPTYGAYYTTTPEDTVSPMVLSFEELAEGGGNRPETTCVVTAPQRLTSANAYSFLGPTIYEAADPKGPVGPAYPMTYQLTLDLSEGEVDRDHFGADRQGISFIGAADINASQRWTLTGLETGKTYEFVITAAFQGGDRQLPFLLLCFNERDGVYAHAYAHTFAGIDPHSMQWSVPFVAKEEKAVLVLTHEYTGPEFEYISFSSFALREMD